MSRRLTQSTVLQLASHRATRARVARISAQRSSPVIRAADRLLFAKRFHPRMIAALAVRSRFAESVSHLAKFAEPDRTHNFELPGLLHEPVDEPIRIWRLVIWAGLEGRDSNRTLHPLSLEEIRQRARAEPAARLTLAAIGEITWGAATRRERAAFCLQALIAALRSRAS